METLINHENYQLMLDKTLEEIKKSGIKPRLLLHSCCAPCSSYVLEYLSEYFDITLFYYNPNISPKEEFDYRVEELKRLVEVMPLKRKPEIIVGAYEPERFEALAKGYEDFPEGGARCKRCYALRLEETAKLAALGKYDFFTTTLSISPYKDAEALNAIGKNLSEKYKINYLFSDFKKKNGYLRSIRLSEEYSLYRQNFCGCVFSKRNG